MSLNNIPSANRIHIGIFGKRNAGKSSVLNAITSQSLAIVSDIKGTTTDPVLKAMELLPLGPVVIIDTPGLDDDGTLGTLRIQKAYQMLNKTDIALLIVDASLGISKEDQDILARIQQKQIPYLIVFNKSDLIDSAPNDSQIPDSIFISTKTGQNLYELKESIAKKGAMKTPEQPLAHDLFSPADLIVLVVPIDSAAPKGRLILPQQQTLRDILDYNGVSIVTSVDTLAHTLKTLKQPPALVVTDSQAFAQVAQLVPENIPLTSFSILFARYRGDLGLTKEGALAIDTLKDGDKILISEGCTHHRQCDDIGTVKLPRLLQKYTQKNLLVEFTSGTEFPDDLSSYKLIIHCGGCMLPEREMKYRLRCAKDQGISITNYGIAIAHMNGILERSMKIVTPKRLDVHTPF